MEIATPSCSSQEDSGNGGVTRVNQGRGESSERELEELC